MLLDRRAKKHRIADVVLSTNYDYYPRDHAFYSPGKCGQRSSMKYRRVCVCVCACVCACMCVCSGCSAHKQGDCKGELSVDDLDTSNQSLYAPTPYTRK